MQQAIPHNFERRNKMFIKRALKVFVIAIASFVFATITYAFAAGNTGIPAQKAGDGAAAITGYAVSSIQYHLNDTDPGKIDSVTFTLDASATTVKVRVDADGDYYSSGTSGKCTASGNVWTCDTTSPQLTVTAADNLRIIALDH